MIKQRYLHAQTVADLREKMVFIAGPRQVGKTTFAKNIGGQDYNHPLSLNWDNREDRKSILHGIFEAENDLIIFDEIHKYRSWKNHLKGIYDKYHERFSMLVTGSARLDLYRKGGDSLFGRYHLYRLHPFSLGELQGSIPQITPFKELSFGNEKKKSIQPLLVFGGFPEPLFHQNQKTWRRWTNTRTDRLIQEDIRDVELIRDLSALQILVELLLEKAAGRFSLNTLREDLQVTHKTIALWTNILEKFYYHFRIYPFSTKIIRSIRKEPKLYLWDWSPIQDEGRKFENLIASHLLKFVHYLHDTEGYDAELFYLRDMAGREVDFLVTIQKKPWFAVEVKTNDKEPSKHLRYFGDRLRIPHLYQVITSSSTDILRNDIRIISADKFLTGLV